MAAYQEVLGATLTPPQRALLTLALGFYTWRSLARDSGMSRDDAAALMVQAIEGAGAG